MLVIVPNDLRDQLQAAIDKALAGRPCDEETRAELYRQLLVYYNEHGTIPSFDLRAT